MFICDVFVTFAIKVLINGIDSMVLIGFEKILL